jgi:antagonist of KipI
MNHVRVIRPGMLTTAQDLGRWGSQEHGVPVAGPMDEYSHRLANRLVGNEPGAAALEVTLIGPELNPAADVICAVTGAEFVLTIGGTRVPCHEAFVLHGGQALKFGERTKGARAAVAFRGGIVVEPVLGSRATSLFSAMGGLNGRALRAGDLLTIGEATVTSPSTARGAALPMRPGGATLRVMVGPHEDFFTRTAYDTLFGSRFTVTPASNRMGYRLEGPPLAHAGGVDILSDATPLGSIQVPASGQPILLMADRQTTGGYPKIATVITADMPLAGQLSPGDWIEFRACTRQQAVEALRDRMRQIGSRAG